MSSIFSLDTDDFDLLSEPAGSQETSPILTESDLFQFSEHSDLARSDDALDHSSSLSSTSNDTGNSIFQDNYLEYSDQPRVSGSLSSLARPNRIDTPHELWYNGENPMVLFQVEGQDFLVPHKPLSSKSLSFYQFMSSPDGLSDLFQRGPNHQFSGLPRIIFLGVSNLEATHFFRALYDAEFFEGPPHRTELDIVLAVFKLSSLYKVQFLRQRALSHLNLAFPSGEIEEWDKRFKEGATTFPIERAENIGGTSHTLGWTLDIIDLCSTYDAPWILPAAFYEACQYDLDSLLKHPKWRDGTLTEELKNIILLGYYNHRQESSQILSFLHMQHLKICANNPICFQYRLETLKKIYTDDSSPRPMQDFLGKVWDTDAWDEMLGKATCDSCYRICKARHEHGRVGAWSRLPGMYALPSWNTLRARRDSEA